VTDRYYKGFPRTMEELLKSVLIFKEKKEVIMFNIKKFTLLNTRVKNEMIRYLEEFYQIIDDKKSLQSAFITNARTN
nr:hypothetical protein [Chitinophagaceae bacterium]